jgi:wyosine [tRNA(Phe)-imidazoG37] synthetase (radical SAM superfamily)
METLKEREHDFSSKLRQGATLPRLRDYIQWQRRCRIDAPERGLPIFGPISINLDLTSACNFSCPFCVDSKLINTGKSLTLGEIKKTIDTLHSQGLLSVILVGGGEPTLHKDFEEIVRYIKSKRLQVGVVTNGSRLEKVEAVVEELKEKDWIRISIDAAGEEVYNDLHLPKHRVTLAEILERLRPNMEEMVRSVELAKEFSFDYVSFKPCLIRFNDSQRETLLKDVEKMKEKEIVDQIQNHLQKARRFAGDQVKILESPNLKAVLNQETDRIKRQPKKCHLQFFRTVLTPFGIFHCPAFRGVEEARIGGPDGYLSATKFKESIKKTAHSILTFDAEQECKEVGCFYNRTNWWLEEVIRSQEDIHTLEKVENDNFFL